MQFRLLGEEGGGGPSRKNENCEILEGRGGRSLRRDRGWLDLECYVNATLISAFGFLFILKLIRINIIMCGHRFKIEK